MLVQLISPLAGPAVEVLIDGICSYCDIILYEFMCACRNTYVCAPIQKNISILGTLSAYCNKCSQVCFWKVSLFIGSIMKGNMFSK